MPLYEYRCRQCGELSEVMQRVSDPPLAACPSCGGEVKKLISAPAFQFKGSGWYVTDYARKGGGEKAAETTKPAGETAATGAGGEAKAPAESTATPSKSAAGSSTSGA